MNYNPANLANPLPSAGDCGNRMIFSGSAVVGANLTTADAVRPCSIAGGTRVDRIVIKNPDLDSGTTLAINIGFAHMDGSAATDCETAAATAMSLTPATLVAAAATTWQGAATTTYEIFPPFLVEADSFLQVVPTVGGTGTGTVYAKVEGEAVGIK